jgi:hypothetical protein
MATADLELSPPPEHWRRSLATLRMRFRNEINLHFNDTPAVARE